MASLLRVRTATAVVWARSEADGRLIALDAHPDRFPERWETARPSSLLLRGAGAGLLAPVPPGAAVYGVGLNYHEHAASLGKRVPEAPYLFLKAPGSVCGPRDALEVPAACATLDYEGELAVVIGAACHRVPAARAQEYLAGFTVANDVTERALAEPASLLLAKSLPRLCSIGPAIVPLPLAQASGLRLRTWVNGELRQDASTGDLIHDVAAVVERLSSAIALRPGDVILTGSPAGTGASLTPPRYLEGGDLVRVEIDGIGCLENRVAGSGK